MTNYGTNKVIVLTGSTVGTGELSGNILNPAAAVTSLTKSSLSASILIRVNNASAANDILTCVFPGQSTATITGSNISVTVPNATNVSDLAPIYTVSDGATGNPVSGRLGILPSRRVIP